MNKATLSEDLGFGKETFTVHTSRTLMLQELSELLDCTGPETSRNEYSNLIIESNVLAKPTISSRKKTSKYLLDLYAFDANTLIFRVLRFFWQNERTGRPLLAALCAHARDSLLRQTADIILTMKEAEKLNLDVIKCELSNVHPARFSPQTLHSTAQNIASSFEQSGHLVGRRIKTRVHPIVTPANVAYALLLGYLCGERGQNLFNTEWARLLDIRKDRIANFASQAHRLGWVEFRNIGNVVDISFNNLLTKEEREVIDGTN